MDCRTRGFPVHHHLPELAQTHVHRVGDAIQPSPPTFNLSQHQDGLIINQHALKVHGDLLQRSDQLTLQKLSSAALLPWRANSGTSAKVPAGLESTLSLPLGKWLHLPLPQCISAVNILTVHSLACYW